MPAAKRLRLSISVRLALIFAGFGLAILAAMTSLAYVNARASLEAATVAELVSTAIEKQAALDAWIADRQAALINIARSAHLVDEAAALVASGRRPADPALQSRITEDLRAWAGAGRGFRELLILDPNTGEVIAATDAGDVGKFKEDRPFFIQGRAGPYVQNPYFDLAFGGPTATAAAPVLSADGQLVAVLAGHLDLAEMDQIVMRRTGLHRSDDTFLVNTARLLVTQPRLMGDPSVLKRMLTTDAVSRCLERASGSISAPDYRGVPSLIVYRWLPGPQLCLITKIDEDEANAAERSLGIVLLAAGGLVMLAAVGVSYWLSLTITYPIRRLTAGALQVGTGNLDHRIREGGSDEIGDLARAFNAMTAGLSQSMAESARRQRLLVAVNQVSQAVQQSRSVADVFTVLAREVTNLGYVPVIAEVVPESGQLTLPFDHLDDERLDAARELLGISPKGLVVTPPAGGYIDQAVREERGVFVDSAAVLVAEALPEPARPLAAQLADRLNLQQVIVAPIMQNGKPLAVLSVAGVGLTDADVPAFTALASQAAIALENARLYQEALSWAAELEERVSQRTSELRVSEERYRALAEAAPDMIYAVDPEDRVQYLNKFAAARLGVDAGQAIGAPRETVFPASLFGLQSNPIHQVMHTGLPLSSEECVVLGGQEVWLNTWLVPMRDPHGLVISVMGVSRDISKRKQAEEGLKSFSLDLERSNKELEQFAYVASHDLQEPLRMVASYTQLLGRRYRGRLDADADEFIGYAVEGATRMQRMIDDLLAFSRVGTRGESFRPTDLSAVLDDVLNDLQVAIRDSGAVVTHDPMPTVVGDRSQLIRLFQNLIGNAVKFHGEEAPRVHVSAVQTPGGWEFAVADNGIGIDPKYFDRVFIIFRRLHGRTDFPGTGIGLAICKKIVERHGGRIWLKSEPGKGSTFFFTFPLNGKA